MPHTVSTAPDSSPTARRSVSLVDCDVHNQPTSIDDLMPHLSERWRIYMEESGFKSPPGPTYPKGFELAAGSFWTPGTSTTRS